MRSLVLILVVLGLSALLLPDTEAVSSGRWKKKKKSKSDDSGDDSDNGENDNKLSDLDDGLHVGATLKSFFSGHNDDEEEGSSSDIERATHGDTFSVTGLNSAPYSLNIDFGASPTITAFNVKAEARKRLTTRGRVPRRHHLERSSASEATKRKTKRKTKAASEEDSSAAPDSSSDSSADSSSSIHDLNADYTKWSADDVALAFAAHLKQIKHTGADLANLKSRVKSEHITGAVLDAMRSRDDLDVLQLKFGSQLLLWGYVEHLKRGGDDSSTDSSTGESDSDILKRHEEIKRMKETWEQNTAALEGIHSGVRKAPSHASPVTNSAKAKAVSKMITGFNLALGKSSHVPLFNWHPEDILRVLDEGGEQSIVGFTPVSSEKSSTYTSLSARSSSDASSTKAEVTVDPTQIAGGALMAKAAAFGGLEAGAGLAAATSTSTVSSSSDAYISATLTVTRMIATLRPAILNFLAPELLSYWRVITAKATPVRAHDVDGKIVDINRWCDFMQAYRHFFNDFGSHWIKSAKLGGMVRVTAKMSREDSQKIDIEKIEGYLKAAVDGLSASTQHDSEVVEMIRSQNVKITYNWEIVGGDEGMDLFDDVNGIPVFKTVTHQGRKVSAIELWKESLAHNLGIVGASLQPIQYLTSTQSQNAYDQAYGEEAMNVYMSSAVVVDRMAAIALRLRKALSNISKGLTNSAEALSETGYKFGDNGQIEKKHFYNVFNSQEARAIGAQALWYSSRIGQICKFTCEMEDQVRLRLENVFQHVQPKDMTGSCLRKCTETYHTAKDMPHNSFNFLEMKNAGHTNMQGTMTKIGHGYWQVRNDRYFVLDGRDPETLAYWKDKAAYDAAPGKAKGKISLKGALAIATSNPYCAYGFQILRPSRTYYLCTSLDDKTKWLEALSTYNDIIEPPMEQVSTYPRFSHEAACFNIYAQYFTRRMEERRMGITRERNEEWEELSEKTVQEFLQSDHSFASIKRVDMSFLSSLPQPQGDDSTGPTGGPSQAPDKVPTISGAGIFDI